MHNTELNEAPQQGELDKLIRTTEELLQKLKAAKKQGASNIPTEQHSGESLPEPAPQGSFKIILKSIIQEAQRLLGACGPDCADRTERHDVETANELYETAMITRAYLPVTNSGLSVPIAAQEPAPPSVSDPDAPATGPALPELHFRDLSPLNEVVLEQLFKQAGSRGYIHISLKDLPPVRPPDYIRQPNANYATAFTHSPQGSFRKIIQLEKKNYIDFPVLPLPHSPRRHTLAMLEGIWVDAIKRRQLKSTYVIGPPLFHDIHLSPGRRLEERGSRPDVLKGIQTAYDYLYLSDEPMATAMHREDLDFFSLNILRSGEAKLWLIVEPDATDRFEERMRQEFPDIRHCTQAVRHIGLSICPSKLREWDIAFSIVCCEEGQAILTAPRAYHQILNLGKNYARAINIELPSSPDTPCDYQFCSKACDPHAITEEDVQPRQPTKPVANSSRSIHHSAHERSITTPQKRHAPDHTLPQAKKPHISPARTPLTRPKRQLPYTELSAMKAAFKKHDRLLLDVVITPLTDTAMFRRLCAVQGGPAIRQLCSLVAFRRQCETDIGLLHTTGPNIERTVQLLNSLELLSSRSAHDKVLIRLLQFHMAHEVDGTQLAPRSRADTHKITKTMERIGWPPAKRNTFHSHLRHGRDWRRLCGSSPGLLCLIPIRAQEPYSLGADDFLRMENHDIKSFHDLAKELLLPQLYVAAEAFQLSVLGQTPDVEFAWETKCPGLDRQTEPLPGNELASLLQPVPACEGNLYDPDQYPEWPRPEGWPEPCPWPSDPTLVLEGPRCELCTELHCDCDVQKFSTAKPRIKRYGEQILGLQAVSHQEGEIIYQEGDLIGRLSGVIIPTGTYDDEWAFNVNQPGLPATRSVCQIYVGDRGSFFRLLRSSESPNVSVRQMVVSGRIVIAVVAKRDIYHGQQLLKELTGPCEVGSRTGHSRRHLL